VRWLGTYGLSFVLWLIAAWGAFVRPWIWLAFLALPLGALLLPTFDAPDRHALLIQTEESDSGASVIPSVEADNIDLAVLPEYATYGSASAAIANKRGPTTLARRFDSPVVFGAVEGEYGEAGFRNIAVVLDDEGQLIGTFTKQRPVPLFSDGVRGAERPVFPVAHGTLGVAICYDFDAPAVASSLTRNGATVFVDPTYDGMSWGRIQHVHHEQLLRLRAVENDRWILRAASSGRSEAIDPHGRPSDAGVEIGRTGYVVVEYGHRHGVPPGAWAAYLGPAAGVGSGVIVLWLAWSWWRGWRRRVAALASLSG
jgi:apolipoprotein N-acyltransferase